MVNGNWGISTSLNPKESASWERVEKYGQWELIR